MLFRSLNRYKKMYIALLVGFFFNTALNVPFMILFHKIGLPIYYGNLVATMLGYSITICISLCDIKKTIHISYKKTFKHLGYILLCCFLMFLVLSGLSYFIPITGYGRGMSIVITIIYAIVCAIIYFGSTYLTHTFQTVIGKELLQSILRRKK